MKVGISGLRGAVGAYVDHAAAGGTVVIMRRGRPVAKMVRLPEAEKPQPCGSCGRHRCTCPTLLDGGAS
jgi:antitoxin (DNA-binding transcriptional repressor) of toxin-antitoxin stability system